MRKKHMVCAALLTAISISGCGEKYERTEEMLKSILADDQEVVEYVNDIVETTIQEITFEEVTTIAETTTQEVTTIPETTNQETTTQQETTTHETTTQEVTTIPETTTQEVTTEEETTTTAVVEKVVDLNEAKEAFKKYFAENSQDYIEDSYNCWVDCINDTVFTLFDLDLYAYRDGAVVNMNFGSFDKYTDKYIFYAYGGATTTYHREITDVYTIEEDNVAYLCSYVHIYYTDGETITKESYHKVTEDYFITKNYKDMENDPATFVNKEEYDSVHENIKTVLYADTIDEAFAELEERNK